MSGEGLPAAAASAEVLGRYLDHLLREVPQAGAQGSAHAAPAAPPAAAARASRGDPPDACSPAPAAVLAPARITLLPPAVGAATEVPVPAPAPEPPAAARSAAPDSVDGPGGDWRQAPFQALLFRVAELTLAAPLVRLYGVIPWQEQVTGMPGGPDWYLGLLHHREQNVRVVDTANLLHEGRVFDAAAPPRHIILLDEGRWGITCDGLSSVLAVTPEQVRWRAAPASRPWLAGILRERLCAVLDVDALAVLLGRT